MTEWVPSLSARTKWYKERNNLKVGDVALVISSENKRAHWPMGRVIETYPGKDRCVRSVKQITDQACGKVVSTGVGLLCLN